MDRRIWLQVLGVLSAARPAWPQAPAAGGRGGQSQPQPMRITKEQVTAALVILGLEFQDAEIEMMLRNVNNGLAGFDTIRKLDVPLDTEPAFAFHPGLPDRKPIRGPARFLPAVSRAPVRAPHNLEDVAFW